MATWDRLLFQRFADDVDDDGIDPLGEFVSQHFPARFGNVAVRDDSRPQRVVQIVVDVGDDVGDAHDLTLQALGELGRIDGHHRPHALGVFGDAVAHVEGQVQPQTVVFQFVHDAQALLVVPEPAGAEFVENRLADVAERGVTQVVAEGDGLGQVLVQVQRPGDGPGDLAHFEGVGQARPVMVASRRDETPGSCA